MVRCVVLGVVTDPDVPLTQLVTDRLHTRSRFQPWFEQVRWKVRTAWTRLEMRVGQHRSLRSNRQVLSVALACSPSARILAWARLTPC